MGVIPEDEGALSQISSTPVARGDVEQMPHPKPYSAMIEEHEKQMPDTSYHYKLRPDEVHRWKGHHFPKDMSFEERANMIEELQHRQGQIKELQSRNSQRRLRSARILVPLPKVPCRVQSRVTSP